MAARGDGNLRVVTDYLAAAGRGDFGAAAALFAPDVRYHVPGRNRLSGERQGPDAVLDYFGSLSRLTGGTYGIVETVDWLEGGDRVLLVAKEHAALDGASHDWTRLVLFRIANGVMAEVWLFEDDQDALDAFLGGGGTGGTTGTEDVAGPPAMFGALDDPKVQAIAAYQQALAQGDLAAARTVFDPDVVYHVPGRNPFSGDYRGGDAVMGYLGRLMEETGGTYAISRMDWLASDERVALVTRNHARRGERSLAWDEAILFRFRDGKKRRIDLFSGDQAAVDAFWA